MYQLYKYIEDFKSSEVTVNFLIPSSINCREPRHRSIKKDLKCNCVLLFVNLNRQVFIKANIKTGPQGSGEKKIKAILVLILPKHSL